MLYRTRGVKDQFFQDVDKILFWTTIFVQSIFFGYYGYSIYTSFSNNLFLVIYVLLFIVSTINFIYFLISYTNKSEKNVKIFKKTFRLFKYVVNGSMVIINIIEIVKYSGSDLAYILVILSILSLIFQVIVEFLRGFVSMYIELLSTAFERDTSGLTSGIDKIKNVTNVKGHILGTIDAPLEKLVTKKENSIMELSKKEKLVDNLGEKYKEKLIMKKKHKKEKKKERYLSKANKEGKELKEHTKILYNKIVRKKKV